MAGFYQKMMISTIEDSISDLCGPYCEPEKNQLGFCPTSCIPFCYPICNRPFLHAIPSIPPYAAAKTTHHVHQTRKYEDFEESHNVFLLFFLSMLIVGLLIFICYASSKLCKSWIASRREAEEEAEHEIAHPVVFLDQEREGEVDHPSWHIRTDGLSPSVINSITVFKFKKDGGLIQGSMCSVCPVCLSNFQEDETLRLLPICNHAFHVACIDTWLQSHKTCPVCRSDIVLPEAALPSSPPEKRDLGAVCRSDIVLPPDVLPSSPPEKRNLGAVCRSDIVLPQDALPSSPPEKINLGGDSEKFRNQEGADTETETGEVGFQRRENDSVVLSRKQ